MGMKKGFFLVVLMILVPMSFALITINPQKYNINDIDYNRTYNIVITIINPDATPYDIQIVPNSQTSYLMDFTKLDTMKFRLEPNDRKNIMMVIRIDSALSPEVHNLYLGFMSSNHELAQFKLSFEIKGNKTEKLVLKNISLNKPSRDLIYFDLNLENLGNVIAKGSPDIEIRNETGLVDHFGEQSTITIMPGQTYNLSLMYDTSNILPGHYSYAAKFKYNDLETNYLEGDFKIASEEESEETITVAHGEPVLLKQAIPNPTGGLVFYRISYDVFGHGIGDTLEGETRETNKVISIPLDSSELTPGTYEIRLDIEYGQELENEIHRTVSLGIKREQNMSVFIFSLLILCSILAAIVFWVQSLPRRLEQSIIKLHSQYNHMDYSIRYLTKDVQGFVHESNNWMAHNGFTQGFR